MNQSFIAQDVIIMTQDNMDKINSIQKEIGIMEKTEENPFFKSKYFDINALLAQLKPLLEKYQLMIMTGLRF